MTYIWTPGWGTHGLPRDRVPVEALVLLDHAIELFGLTQPESPAAFAMDVQRIGPSIEYRPTITVFLSAKFNSFLEWHDDHWVGWDWNSATRKYAKFYEGSRS